MTKPGKVSKDYIDGKRSRYSNPFQFYLTVSVLFFLLIGLTKTYDKFNALNSGANQKTSSSLAATEIATLKKKTNTELDKALKETDSTELKKIKSSFPLIATDTVNSFQLSTPKLDAFLSFRDKYPTATIDDALDSLHYEKTFLNRFLYERMTVANAIFSKKENREEFSQQIISHISISLFVFLPLFTLFLKLFYLRKRYTYVEHLVFVFHTQTVFFLLLAAFFMINYIKDAEYIMAIFFLLFLGYLLKAMRRFYQQGSFKTFVKFILLNIIYLTFAIIGMIIVSFISFALY